MTSLPPPGAVAVASTLAGSRNGVSVALPVPDLYITSTTSILAGGALSVVKRRLPLRCPRSPELELRAREQAEQATIDEATWLAEARHRTVVRLTRVAPATCSLETAYAGRISLRTAQLSARDAASALQSVAVTVGELHDRGLIHGQLAPDHVIVDTHPPGQLVLCSPRPGADDPTIDTSGMVRLADQLRLRLAPRSPAWASALADLQERTQPIDIAELVEVFGELGRSRVSLSRLVRSLGLST